MDDSQMRIKSEFFDRLNCNSTAVLPEILISDFCSLEIPEGKLVCVGDSLDDTYASMQLNSWGYFYVKNGDFFGILIIPYAFERNWDRPLSYRRYVEFVQRKSEIYALADSSIHVHLPRTNATECTTYIPDDEQWTLRVSVRLDHGPLELAMKYCERLFKALVKDADALSDRIGLMIENALSNESSKKTRTWKNFSQLSRPVRQGRREKHWRS